jgi:hypothetical protein
VSNLEILGNGAVRVMRVGLPTSGYLLCMGLLRGLAGTLLWVVSALVGLVAVILCATVILLPVGLPLLGYAGRLFALSVKLILPRAVSQPVDAADRSLRKRGRKAKSGMLASARKVKRRGRGRAGRKTRQVRRKVLAS